MKRGPWIRGGLLGPMLSAALVGAPTSAHAGDPTIDVFVNIGQNQATTTNATIVTPRLKVGIPATDRITVDAEWGFTTVTVPVIADNGIDTFLRRETGLLNPYVSVSYGARAEELYTELGLGISLPAADADDPNRAAAFLVALGSVGAWNPFLYLPSTLGITLPMEGRIDFDEFTLAVDAAFFLLIPTSNTEVRTTQFGAEASVEGFIPVGWFDLGMRLQAVQVGSSGPEEAYLQTSWVPFARLFIDRVVLLAHFNFNFDTPHGTTFGEAGTWGVMLGGGIEL